MIVITPGGGGSGSSNYQTVQDETVALTQRGALNFTGGGVAATDNAGTGVTDVTINAGAVADADATTKGILKLTNDLGGTALLPTVPGLAAKAPLASPTFTGTPAVPTAATGTNTTRAASTAFVQQENAVIVKRTVTADATLVLTDAGLCIEANHATNAIVITIPPNSSVAYPLDTVLEFCRYGAGTMTITPGAGVTIPNRIQAAGTTSRTLPNQMSCASVRQRATNEWILSGDFS